MCIRDSRWTVPPEPLNSWIFPPVPTGTMTVFGMFCPAWKFRFEVFVLSIPNGHTVMYPAVCGDTTVTFSTAPAADGGCPATTLADTEPPTRGEPAAMACPVAITRATTTASTPNVRDERNRRHRMETPQAATEDP